MHASTCLPRHWSVLFTNAGLGVVAALSLSHPTLQYITYVTDNFRTNLLISRKLQHPQPITTYRTRRTAWPPSASTPKPRLKLAVSMDPAPSSTLRQPPSAVSDCPAVKAVKTKKKKMRAARLNVAGTEPSSLEASTSPITSPTTPTSSGDESQAAVEAMPRPSQLTKAAPFKRPEVDLSAMLSVEQLKQLQVLLGAIMDELQMQVRDTFDKMNITPVAPTEGMATPKIVVLSVPNPASDKYRSQYGDIGIPSDKPDFEDYDLLLQIMKAHSVNHGTVNNRAALTIPKSQDDATFVSKKTETELAMASLTELQRDALGHFGKWRGLVHKRLQEIVIKNGGTGGNVVRQGPQQAPGNARRVGGIVRGSTAARQPGKFSLSRCTLSFGLL